MCRKTDLVFSAACRKATVVLTSPGKMADSGGPVSAKRCDYSLNPSSVSMDTITALTELEDLERVYQQLCTEEVSSTSKKICLFYFRAGLLE